MKRKIFSWSQSIIERNVQFGDDLLSRQNHLLPPHHSGGWDCETVRGCRSYWYVRLQKQLLSPLQGGWGCERVLTILIILTRLSAYYDDESGQDKNNADTSVLSMNMCTCSLHIWRHYTAFRLTFLIQLVNLTNSDSVRWQDPNNITDIEARCLF